MTQQTSTSIYDLHVKRLDGTPESLDNFRGKVCLIVNTASECGFTPQYAELEALHSRYQGRGFAVLGFPSNDFGAQEPGDAASIARFCEQRFSVTFPMFEKTRTKGAEASELYRLLANQHGEPKWNFHKYLVDKQGNVVRAFDSAVKPESEELTSEVERLLANG